MTSREILMRALSAPMRAIALPTIWSSELSAKLSRRVPRGWWKGLKVRSKRQGIYWELLLDDNVQRTLFLTGFYERRYLRELCRLVAPGSVVLDVGAHVGIHSIELARRVSSDGQTLGRVIAVEASSATCAALRRNLAENRISNVAVVNVAAGSTLRTEWLCSEIHRWEQTDLAVRSIYGDGVAIESVEIKPLDLIGEIQQLERLDLVKLDIEGMELEALQGMQETLRRLKPIAIGLEMRPYLMERQGISGEEIQAFMGGLGYSLSGLGEMEGNFLFLRD